MLALALYAFLAGGPLLADEAKPLAFDPARSAAWAVTHRAGIFSFLGHEHAILAPKWRARVQYSASDLGSSSAEITLSVPSFEIDTPEARSTAGLTANGPDAEDRTQLQSKFLGPEVLDASKHSEVVFRSRRIQPGLKLTGELSLHGITKTITCDVKVATESDGSTSFTGTLPIRLPDYEIHPPKTGIFVGVSEDMELHFRFVSRPPTAFAWKSH